ncbi:hypothetical protein [Streptomyces bobili]|uniref:hypothetical protein n=1 Tax=Streptomyces bobili TaxID=67280 RepID=UPI00130295E8|nr:hypothetical protein [Streptomyces bobili]
MSVPWLWWSVAIRTARRQVTDLVGAKNPRQTKDTATATTATGRTPSQQAEAVGDVLDLGAALRAGPARAGGLVAGVLFVLEQDHKALAALLDAGGTLRLRMSSSHKDRARCRRSSRPAPSRSHRPVAKFSSAPRSRVQGLVGSTSPATVRRRRASAWARPAA